MFVMEGQLRLQDQLVEADDKQYNIELLSNHLSNSLAHYQLKLI